MSQAKDSIDQLSMNNNKNSSISFIEPLIPNRQTDSGGGKNETHHQLIKQ